MSDQLAYSSAGRDDSPLDVSYNARLYAMCPAWLPPWLLELNLLNRMGHLQYVHTPANIDLVSPGMIECLLLLIYLVQCCNLLSVESGRDRLLQYEVDSHTEWTDGSLTVVS